MALSFSSTRKLMKREQNPSLIFLDHWSPVTRVSLYFGLLQRDIVNANSLKESAITESSLLKSSLETCTWKQALSQIGCLKEEVLVHRLGISNTASTTQLIISPAVSPYSLESMDADLFKDTATVVISGWDEPSPDSKLAKASILKLQEIGLTNVKLTSFRVSAAAPETIRGKIVVVVQDDAWMSLMNLDPDQFSSFHDTLANASQVIWLSATSSSPCGLGEVHPSGLVGGLARTLRRENPSLSFMTLAVDPTSDVHLLSNHLEIAFLNFLQGVADGTYERDLFQVEGLLQIPRVSECRELNQAVHDYSADWVVRSRHFGEQDLKLCVRQPGLLDTLYFEQPPARGPLGPEEIEVDVKAMGINFRDFLLALGQLHQGQLGTECAGIVRESGSRCHLKPGVSIR
jgi:hypothetical protein